MTIDVNQNAFLQQKIKMKKMLTNLPMMYLWLFLMC